MLFDGEFVAGIDLVDVCLWAFTIFFFFLVLYLQRESMREGYPTESDVTGEIDGSPPFFPAEPKKFILPHGRGTATPEDLPRETRELALKRMSKWDGSPYVPTGDPLVDGVGPASYAERAEYPDLTREGEPRIAPYRVSPGYEVANQDTDPRGLKVFAADRKVAGKVVDLWVDRSESIIRYYEVEVSLEDGRHRRVLLPVPFAQINGGPGRERGVYVEAITADQFTRVPETQHPESVTRREEDRICGYFGGGKLYAMASRQEPLV
ncbi:MAG: photosynthetic reaction center subunit H [Pseudomonadota bacterium]